jgi:peptide/nickel transport system permease protein
VQPIYHALRNDRLALVGVVVTLLFLVVAAFAPQIAPYDPNTIFRDEAGRVLILQPPSLAHPFGTTNLGRDVFSMTIHGTRPAVLVGLLAAFLVTVIGTTLGLVSGFYGGWIDSLIMRLVDILYGIPLLPTVLILIVVLGPGLWSFIIAVTALSWRGTARIIRSQVLSVRERPFVKAGRLSGASTPRLIMKYIAPSILPLALLEMSFTVGWVIITEASVAFIGFGDPNMLSWGQVLQMAFLTGSARFAWWWLVPPGAAIVLFVLAIFLSARTLEGVVNPRLRER